MGLWGVAGGGGGVVVLPEASGSTRPSQAPGPGGHVGGGPGAGAAGFTRACRSGAAEPAGRAAGEAGPHRAGGKEEEEEDDEAAGPGWCERASPLWASPLPAVPVPAPQAAGGGPAG